MFQSRAIEFPAYDVLNLYFSEQIHSSGIWTLNLEICKLMPNQMGHRASR